MGRCCGLEEGGRHKTIVPTPGMIGVGLQVLDGGHTPPVPANHGLRLNDMERFAPPCPPLREPHPEDAVEETDPRSLGAAAEQGELLSQRQVLKNEVGAGLQRSAQSAQQSE